ncbi:MAG: NAD(P)/FAD-dependent oxidoreductase [Deltaproteobacteria bacterium]|nr:NAD(P)/FAD-dependent oxidoreductase [Deltaproteobacteria bacterium]MBK9366510.1 NAD(P)/FAD-dependent oxidoreductase [Deltaproteobacteria bacterium]
MSSEQVDVVIIGGGAAGISVAARLAASPRPPSIVLVEPSTRHHYQPLWTLVGAGVFPKEQSERQEAELIPAGVRWVKERAVTFDPDNHEVTLSDGTTLRYNQLVVAMGIQIDWALIPGLKESVGKPGSGVVSNYSYETVSSTWDALRAFPKGGRAIFTHPSTPIKCGGAPIKICFLADDHLRRRGARESSHITFVKAGGGIFAVKKYADALTRVAARKHIETVFTEELVSIDVANKAAVFRDLTTKTERVRPFDLLHVTPPMSAPDVLKQSPLAGAGGWVDVHKHTLQHSRYPDVFSLGDCSNLPTSKTGAAIRKQAPVLVENLLAHREGRPLLGHYDGYTSCPLVTGYGKLILAEFDYTNTPKESFPFDQSQERLSMYMLKAYALPDMYWNGMLRGRM